MYIRLRLKKVIFCVYKNILCRRLGKIIIIGLYTIKTLFCLIIVLMSRELLTYSFPFLISYYHSYGLRLSYLFFYLPYFIYNKNFKYMGLIYVSLANILEG